MSDQREREEERVVKSPLWAGLQRGLSQYLVYMQTA